MTPPISVVYKVLRAKGYSGVVLADDRLAIQCGKKYFVTAYPAWHVVNELFHLFASIAQQCIRKLSVDHYNSEIGYFGQVHGHMCVSDQME